MTNIKEIKICSDESAYVITCEKCGVSFIMFGLVAEDLWTISDESGELFCPVCGKITKGVEDK